MASSANQSSGYGSTGKPKGKVKPRATRKPPAHEPPGQGRYSWNNGPRVHSIPQNVHDDRVTAQRTLGTQDLTAPPTAGQAIREATSAADAQYGPQLRAAQQGLANTAPWFQDYMARVAGYATTAKTQAQPVLNQAAKLADPNTAAQTQAAPGLDPNSEAGRASAMAAQGRAALGALGKQALDTNAQSTQDYFGGLQATAAREQPLAQQAAADRLAGVQSDRGNAISTFLRDARANAQNYTIARGTLAGNTKNAETQNLIDAGYDPVTGKKLPGKPRTGYGSGAPGLNTFGYTADEWAGLSDSEKAKARAGKGKSGSGGSGSHGLTPAQKLAQKNREGAAVGKRRAASDKETSRITDIVSRIDLYGQRNVNTGKKIKGKDGKDVDETLPGRKIPGYVREQLLKAGFTSDEITLAVKVKTGKPLTQHEIELAHRLGIKVPSAWRPKEHGPQGSGGNAPAQGGNRPT